LFVQNKLFLTSTPCLVQMPGSETIDVKTYFPELYEKYAWHFSEQRLMETLASNGLDEHRVDAILSPILEKELEEKRRQAEQRRKSDEAHTQRRCLEATRFMVVGGYCRAPLCTAEAYSPALDTWFELPEMSTARVDPAVAVVTLPRGQNQGSFANGGKGRQVLVVAGGFGEGVAERGSCAHNTVEYYDPHR
jgi:hypothetical protein